MGRPARGGIVCSGVFLCGKEYRESCLDTQASTVTCGECTRRFPARETTWNSLNWFERAKAGGIRGNYYCINTGNCYHHKAMNKRIRKRKQNELKHRNGNQL